MRRVVDLDDMLARFRARPRMGVGRLVTLDGLNGMDGYNPSGPVPDGAESRVFVRVEPRNVDFASWSVPFRQQTPYEWTLDPDLPMLRLEDPFVAIVQGEYVLGGVRITLRIGAHSRWETVFFRGQTLLELEEFACSPAHMKDVRLLQLTDGSIGIFTRPWNNGARQVGFTRIDSLGELNKHVLAEAPLLPAQPTDGQWWGVNAAYPLPDGTVGVLGHIAKLEGAQRRYFAIAFVLDSVSREILHGPDIVAERACFPPAPARREDLVDVVFPASFDADAGLLYCGLSDSTIGVMPIQDPFEMDLGVEDEWIA